MKKIFYRFSLLCLVFALTHCGLTTTTTKTKGANYPNKVSTEMQAAFDRAEEEFRNKKYDQAKVSYQNYVSTYPYNRLSDEAQFRIGQIYMVDRQYSEASQLYSQLIQKTPSPEVLSRAAVKAGISEYRLKNFPQSLSFFEKVRGEHLGDSDQAKAGALAKLMLKDSDIEKKAYYDALLLDSTVGLNDAAARAKFGDELPPRGEVQSELEAWAPQTVATSKIDSRFSTYRGRESSPYILYKLGMASHSEGDSKKARAYLSELTSSYSNSPWAEKAKPVLAQLGAATSRPRKAASKGKVYKIGVILPLSGKYQSFGTTTLNGMQCATGEKAPCQGVDNIQLLTRDDGGTPEAAAAAVEDLVKNQDVIAIIGPLSSASADAAAKKAQELGVVMISLAQKEGIPGLGDHIYRFSLTPDQQVEALLRYAGSKQQKEFGVFYPNTNYGKVFLEKFKSLAPSFGAKVTATGSYNNVKDVSDSLRQLKFSVSQVSKENPTGFQALFIPDSYNSILSIVPQLQGAGLENTPLLGTNAWNDPSLGASSLAGLKGAVFLDIYFKDSKNALVKSFVQNYQAAFNQAPSTLEAMGYDIVRFLGKALERGKVKKREEVRSMLSGINYQGVTGLRSFRSDREASVEPYLLTVEGNQIVELNP